MKNIITSFNTYIKENSTPDISSFDFKKLINKCTDDINLVNSLWEEASKNCKEQTTFAWGIWLIENKKIDVNTIIDRIVDTIVSELKPYATNISFFAHINGLGDLIEKTFKGEQIYLVAHTIQNFVYSDLKRKEVNPMKVEVKNYLTQQMERDKSEYKGHIPNEFSKGSPWNDNSWIIDEIAQFLMNDITASYTLGKFRTKYNYNDLKEILEELFPVQFYDAEKLINDK